MKEGLTWKEKYLLSLKESFSIKDIMALRDIGQPAARKIRYEAEDFCIAHKIKYNPSERIPAEALFEVTGKNISFYEERMYMEAKATMIADQLIKNEQQALC